MVKLLKKVKGAAKKAVMSFKRNCRNAEDFAIKLSMVVLVCVITGICGYYLYTPAREIYYSEKALVRETEKISDYAKESEEREIQEDEAKKAKETYTNIMYTYKNDSNVLVAKYASINSNFIKFLIFLAIILPYVEVVWMFFSNIKGFIFALIDIIIIAPLRAAVHLYKALKNNDDSDKSNKNSNLTLRKEATE